ncbi:hypothetical protein MASR2M29_10820 [Spirochaetota bacterium]
MQKTKPTIFYSVLLLAVNLVLYACLPQPLPPGFSPGDLKPPAVISWAPGSPLEVQVFFDEPVADILPDFANNPGLGILSVNLGDTDNSIVVTLDAEQLPGEAYSISGSIADAAGNMSSFILPYWGYNPEPPKLLINELLTEGSAARPDALEFFAMESGNCAGLAFFVGVPGNYQLRYIFPPLKVEAGDYIILHLKPQGLPVELDETIDKTLSGGADSSAAAWDLWYRQGDGALPGKNAVLSLCLSPVGNYMDAVAYSERTVDSDSKYGGFGTTALLNRIMALAASGAWTFSDPPRPEDCARSTGTTSTRTICRNSESFDSNSGSDWHVVPTRGISLGGPNTDDVHEP